MKMKKFLFTILIIFLLIFLKYSSVYTQPKQHVNIIKEHFKDLNDHNISALIQLYAENAKIESTGFDSVRIGHKGLEEVYSRYFLSSPDLKYQINNIIYSKDFIIVEYIFSGTMKKVEDKFSEFMLDKAYKLKACSIFKILENKIVSSSTYFDQVSFLRQMNYFDQKK